VLGVATGCDADLVLFGGDLFHARRTINVAAFNATYEAMAAFRVQGIPLVLIHGNHDQADKHGEEHSVHAFRTFATVCDQPGWELVTGKSGTPYAIMGVPYTENLAQVQDAVREPSPVHHTHRILLAHLGVQGATLGADFVYANPHDAKLSDLNLDAFDAAFLGHYHKHQQLAERCWYIGAPLQHNWGDRDQWRGCLIYDTDTHSIEKVDLKAPRFEMLQGGQEVPPPDCYVRVEDDRAWTDEKRETMRTMVEARSLEVVPPKNGTKTTTGPRLDIAPSASTQDMLERYVCSGVQSSEGLDEQYLLQLGREIMEEVGGDDAAG
jgi:DNA repair exonuclease SbcCD nuclease subunit